MADWITVIISLLHAGLIVGFAVWYALTREFDTLAPLWPFLGGQLATFGIRPILLCYDDVRFGAFWPLVRFDADGYQWASICGVLATLGILAGHELNWRRSRRASTIIDSMPRKLTFLFFLLGVGGGALALASTLGRSNLPTTMTAAELLSGQARHDIGKETVGYGYETLAWNLIPTYVTMLAARFLGQPPRRPYIVMLGMLAGLVVIGPVGGRALVFLAIAGVGYVWHYRVRRFSDVGSMLLAVVLVASAGIVGNLRSPSGEMDVLDSLAYMSKSFDGFESLVALSKRVSLDDTVWGRTYFEGAYSFIPRVIWSGKPQVFGALAVEGYVYPELLQAYGNVGTFPVGFVAEAIYNFWYFGLLIVPVAAGACLAELQRRASGPSRSSIHAAVAGIVVGNLIGWMRSFGEEFFALLIHLVIAKVMLMPRRMSVSVGESRERLACSPAEVKGD